MGSAGNAAAGIGALAAAVRAAQMSVRQRVRLDRRDRVMLAGFGGLLDDLTGLLAELTDLLAELFADLSDRLQRVGLAQRSQ